MGKITNIDEIHANDSVLQEILKEFEEVKGQFILIDGQLKRLVGVIDDGFDYCYVLFNGHVISYAPCLSRIMRLRGKLDDEDYNEIVRIAKLNHADYKLPNFHDILSIEEEKIDKENIICNSPTIINVAKNKKKIFKFAWEIN